MYGSIRHIMNMHKVESPVAEFTTEHQAGYRRLPKFIAKMCVLSWTKDGSRTDDYGLKPG